jgi:hypothetical protein
MSPNKISFSINEYDSDSDVTTEGVFLHIGETKVKVAESIEDFKEMPHHMLLMIDEMEENYNPITGRPK